MSYLMIVNEEDQILGYEEKIDTHKRGLLHRAFSIFIIDEDNKKIFLQQRADDKYHSGGLWSNACCSHPHKSESWIQAIQRALLNELGLNIDFYGNTDEMLFSGLELPSYKMYFLNKFQYYSNYGGYI
ncbi:MAG: NUDIX domain-containing protein [Clostridia bacterium]|nr:NUDIX domain-containing protein [Clostridia bacterium]MBR2176955.1 NUDIX domain-containing protein [Clostridia bacterium]